MYLSSLIQQLFLTINYIFPQRNNNLINKIGFNNLQNVFIKKPYSIINTILFRLYKEYRLSQCLQSLYVLNRINVLKIKNNFHFYYFSGINFIETELVQYLFPVVSWGPSSKT